MMDEEEYWNSVESFKLQHTEFSPLSGTSVAHLNADEWRPRLGRPLASSPELMQAMQGDQQVLWRNGHPVKNNRAVRGGANLFPSPVEQWQLQDSAQADGGNGLLTQWKGTTLDRVPVSPSVYLIKCDGFDRV